MTPGSSCHAGQYSLGHEGRRLLRAPLDGLAGPFQPGHSGRRSEGPAHPGAAPAGHGRHPRAQRRHRRHLGQVHANARLRPGGNIRRPCHRRRSRRPRAGRAPPGRRGRQGHRAQLSGHRSRLAPLGALRARRFLSRCAAAVRPPPRRRGGRPLRGRDDAHGPARRPSRRRHARGARGPSQHDGKLRGDAAAQ